MHLFANISFFSLYRWLIITFNIITLLLIIAYLLFVTIAFIKKKQNIIFKIKITSLLLLIGTLILIVGNMWEYFYYNSWSGININVLLNIIFLKVLKDLVSVKK